MQPLDETWRYGIISRGVGIPRPNDCFSSGSYAAFRIDDMHVPGRILEVSGSHPPILKVCMFQGNSLCFYSKHSGICNPICRKWLFTTANHAGVLSMIDIFSIFEGSAESLQSADQNCILLDRQGAEKLFKLIDRLETRQKSC